MPEKVCKTVRHQIFRRVGGHLDTSLRLVGQWNDLLVFWLQVPQGMSGLLSILVSASPRPVTGGTDPAMVPV